MTSIEDLLREQATDDGGTDVGPGTSGDANDRMPGGPRTMTQCAIIRTLETPSNNGNILRASRCRVDTVEDTSYASFCREIKSNGSPCDCCEEGSWQGFDGAHPKDLCTDKNLFYCLRILGREEYKASVALILVPSSNAGPKTFKRIGIVYDMFEGFFGDEQEQDVTIV